MFPCADPESFVIGIQLNSDNLFFLIIIYFF